MRVLGITSSVWSLGPGQGMPSLFVVQSALAARGHEVHVLAPVPPWGGAAEERAGALHIHHRRAWLWHRSVPAGSAALSFLLWKLKYVAFVVSMTPPALALARAHRPDLVYGHDPYGAAVAFLVTRLVRVPYVCRLYGVALPPRGEARVRQVIGNVDEWIALKLPAEHWIVTDDGRRGLASAVSWGVAAKRVAFLRNGVARATSPSVEERAAARAALGAAPGDELLACVTRLEGWKGVDRQIAMMPALVARRPGTRLVIAGDGAERARLEALADRLGVRSQVRFLGARPRVEVERLLAAADLFLATADQSNLGNSVLEAMAAGMCVVALDAGETAAVVRDGESGRLVAFADLPRLGEIVAALLDDPVTRARLGAAGRARLMALYPDWDERAARECELVERLAASSVARRSAGRSGHVQPPSAPAPRAGVGPSGGRPRARILVVADPRPTWIARDIEALRRHYAVDVFHYTRRGQIPALASAAARADAALAWFADIHAFLLVRLAPRRVPVIVITGGYDVAHAPELPGYGLFAETGRGKGLRRWMARQALERAAVVLALSASAAAEVRRVARPRDLRVLHLGVDPARFHPSGPKQRRVVTVASRVDAQVFARKGLDTLLAAARELPGLAFSLVAHPAPGAEALLGSVPSNVTVTGRVDEAELVDIYRSSAVVAQFSRHEGFCAALAEAMACGCVPAVSPVAALPEVAGDLGARATPGDARGAAAAITRALADTCARTHARDRVLDRFSKERRERGLVAVLEEARR
jgi:glycosyltransferase involved in cell wall biosynthesis